MTSINTPITTPFGFHSTAAEVIADIANALNPGAIQTNLLAAVS
jgi:hypothetical protein